MPKPSDSNLGKLLGMGLEVAVGVALGYLAGDWLDKNNGSSPWGVLIGVLLGFAAGMYPLIKEGLKQNK